jgi:hypothetical protein
MARTYKRDSKGRFASTGGGGKLGKSAKNEGARAKYKAASSNAREMAKTAKAVAANPKSTAKDKAFWNKKAGGAKSGLTRVSNNLSGKGKKKSAKSSAGVEAARAAGRKKGKAMAAKQKSRNAALDRKAKAYGG